MNWKGLGRKRLLPVSGHSLGGTVENRENHSDLHLTSLLTFRLQVSAELPSAPIVVELNVRFTSASSLPYLFHRYPEVVMNSENPSSSAHAPE
jgi:hypothetical protein